MNDADLIGELRGRIEQLEQDLSDERCLAAASAGPYFTVREHVAFHGYAASIDLAAATPEQRMIKLASAMIRNSKAMAQAGQRRAPAVCKHYHDQGPHGNEVFTVMDAAAIDYIDLLRVRLGMPQERG